MGRMHAASSEKSERLKRTLAALRAGGLLGRTGAELSRATGSLAISTDISELRKNGWIVDRQYEGLSAHGRRVHRYTLLGKLEGA